MPAPITSHGSQKHAVYTNNAPQHALHASRNDATV